MKQVKVTLVVYTYMLMHIFTFFYSIYLHVSLLPFQNYTAGPPKSTFKSGISTNIQKGRPSLSPQQSSPLKFGLAPSTSPAGSNFKKLKAVEDVAFNFEISGKEENAGSERELLGKASESDTLRPDNGLQILPGDLHSALIHLLMENPKGMNLKVITSIPNHYCHLQFA